MSGRALVGAVLGQTRAEIALTVRRGESVLVTVVIPAALLAFFASVHVLPADARALSFLLPGTLTLAVISTGLVSLGIATAYERYYGVLRRFAATPFPRAGLVAAKALAVVVLEAGQVVLLIVIALAFGWRPGGSAPEGLGLLLLGSAAFAGLGLLLAGTLRAETTLAFANAAFLFFLLLGGLFVPLARLPAGLAALARALPAYALADSLRDALTGGGHVAAGSVLVLAAWAVGAPVLAAAAFRWE